MTSLLSPAEEADRFVSELREQIGQADRFISELREQLAQRSSEISDLVRERTSADV